MILVVPGLPAGVRDGENGNGMCLEACTETLPGLEG